MGRIIVDLKNKLLEEINMDARQEGTSRSVLIQRAVEKYIDGKRREREEQSNRKKMEAAARKMDALANKLGKWDPQGIIRKFRDGDFRLTREFTLTRRSRKLTNKHS
jgi:hypothetical protein